MPMPASAKVAEKKVVEQKKGEDDVDEDDLFGDGGVDAAPVVKLEAKPKKKAAPVAKSLILLDVKGWDEAADLDGLAQKIFAVKKDGLLWKTEYKLEPVAFGIKKLVAMTQIKMMLGIEVRNKKCFKLWWHSFSQQSG